jgi:hypothetical protein
MEDWHEKEDSKSWSTIFFFIKWHHAVGLGNCFFVFFIFSAISCRTRHFCERVRVLDTYRYLQQFFSYNMSTWIFCVRIRIRIRIRILGTKAVGRWGLGFTYQFVTCIHNFSSLLILVVRLLLKNCFKWR